MKMSNVEKKFVNSKRHAQKNLELIERLFKNVDLSKINKVLEIGCGVGVVSAHLNSVYRMDVIGTDVDPVQIEIARKYNKENENLKFISANATKLPFENNKFDIVLLLWVMHHINDWDKVLKEINRVLKIKGLFIFSDLAYSRRIAAIGNFASSIRIFKHIVQKYGVYTIDDITNFLKRDKFEIIYRESPKRGVLSGCHNIIFQKNINEDIIK